MPEPKDNREAERWLNGRRIVGVKLNKFRDGRGGWASDPSIELDDGSSILFSVRETEIGEYGVCLIVAGSPKADEAKGERR